MTENFQRGACRFPCRQKRRDCSFEHLRLHLYQRDVTQDTPGCVDFSLHYP